MLHPLLCLVDDPDRGWRLRATTRRSWRPTVLVPRGLCVFENLPCKGVRWHELDGFARLQALRLAPFVRTGASAAVRQGVLMLWFWDEAEVDEAMARAGRPSAVPRRVAETLWLPVPDRSGLTELVCSQGVDDLELRAGAIVGSRWRSPAAKRATQDANLLSRPWARNRLVDGLIDGKSARASAWSWPQTATLVAAVAASGFVAHAAYLAGSVWGAEERLARLSAGASDPSSEAAQVDQLRRAASADRRWVQDYRALGHSLDLPALVEALERPLREYGAVVKELEVRDQDLRLTVVSIGTELDLPGLVQALEKVPGLEDVQVRQNSDPAQAVYGIQLIGFRPLVAAAHGPANSAGLGAQGR